MFFKNKYFQILSAFFIFSFVGVMSKLAANSEIFSIRFFMFVGIQIFLLGVYAIAWQQILKKFTLVSAMSFRGIVVILSLIWAVVIFGENITAFNIIGALMIVVGIYTVSSGDAVNNSCHK